MPGSKPVLFIMFGRVKTDTEHDHNEWKRQRKGRAEARADCSSGVSFFDQVRICKKNVKDFISFGQKRCDATRMKMPRDRRTYAADIPAISTRWSEVSDISADVASLSAVEVLSGVESSALFQS